jgi:hypothetical protein
MMFRAGPKQGEDRLVRVLYAQKTGEISAYSAEPAVLLGSLVGDHGQPYLVRPLVLGGAEVNRSSDPQVEVVDGL